VDEQSGTGGLRPPRGPRPAGREYVAWDTPGLENPVSLAAGGDSEVSAAGFAFACSLGEFGATSFLVRDDRPTLPVVIYRLLGHPGHLNYGMSLAASCSSCPESYSSSISAPVTSSSAIPVHPDWAGSSARYSCAVSPTDAAFTRSGRSLLTSATGMPSAARFAAHCPAR